MKLTKGVEQALCILVLLATQESNKPLASDEISSKLEVSQSYMKKITRKLVVHNIISSVPGTNGGISLVKDFEEITMLDVIEAMEGTISMYKDTGVLKLAFKGGNYTDHGTDLLQQVFAQADDLLIQYFSRITAADLLKKGYGSQELPKLNWNEESLDEHLKKEQGEKL